MKVKVQDLKAGPALDFAVAYSLNGKKILYDIFGTDLLGQSLIEWVKDRRIRPSTDWSQGGPLIEKYQIELGMFNDGWCASTSILDLSKPSYYGDDYRDYNNNWELVIVPNSPLIAACRVIIATELGEEVEIPDELVEGV